MARSQKPLHALLCLFLGLVAVQAQQEPVSAISDCHLDGEVQHCVVDDIDYYITLPPSATEDPPSQYTDCHDHGEELFCYGPGEQEFAVSRGSPNDESEHSDHEHEGGHDHSEEEEEEASDSDSEAVAAAADEEDHEGHDHAEDEEGDHEGHDHAEAEEEEGHEGHDHGSESEDDLAAIGAAADDDELDCHFHAGVEHCSGPEEAEEALFCDRIERDYDVPFRIGTLFIILATSSIGVYGPILLHSVTRWKLVKYIFLVMKQFGVGVIIATAFVHLYTHASLMFDNDCLGSLDYEATTGAIVIAGIMISFLIDYAAHRFMDWRRLKAAGGAGFGHTETGSSASSKHGNMAAITAGATHVPSAVDGHSTKLDVIVLEAGIIFHSVLLGLTSVVADDSQYVTLFIVVVFHQFFEGIALGTRIADIPSSSSSSTSPATSTSTSSPILAPLPRETVSFKMKLLLALPYSLVTPVGMAIGIGVLDEFNGNDRTTIIVIGTLDALSAGVLVWVGVVEMLAKDWLHERGELARAGWVKVLLGGGGLVAGLAVMSLLGRWI